MNLPSGRLGQARQKQASVASERNCVDESSLTSQPQPHQSELGRINQQISLFMKKIDIEKQRIHHLDEKIADNEAIVLEQKRRVGGNDASNKENKIMIEKQIRMLEDRLNKLLVTFNTKVAENKELRRKIDEMRQVRCRYDEIYTKLEYEIQDQAHEMAKVIAQGKKRLKTRYKARSELEAMAHQLEESKFMLKEEKEELARLEEQFDHENTQLPARAKSADKSGRPSTVASQKSIADSTTDPNKETEEFNDDKVMDEALAKVKELTGISDVDALVERLLETEERNFSRFGYLTHSLENEAAKLEKSIADAERELERVKCVGLSSGSHRQKELRSMEEKQRQLETRILDIDLQYREQLDLWENAKESITQTANDLQLFSVDNVIDTDGVTENNVMQYLAALERKTIEIITTLHSDEDENASHDSPIFRNKFLSSEDASINLQLDLPAADDLGLFAEFNDDGERPLTIEELQSSLCKK